MSYQRAEENAIVLANGLEEIAAVVSDQLGLDIPASQLHSRAESLRTDRFRIVVVGGFSRGKSTLLNAVLGCEILPQKVTPSTAIITLIEYADSPSVRIRFVDQSRAEATLSLDEFRESYVLDEKDFKDGQIDTDRFTQIDHAVVFYPVELCRHKVSLVDSPGLQDDPVRTARTKKFLKRADAIVMVLDATKLLEQEDTHFLETVLLPEGLKNIFFAINKWNLVVEHLLRPEDADREFADLERRIRDRLFPFCMIDGRDRSSERIFRLNALGALKARLRKLIAAAMLEESKLPAFEESLQRFLVEDRGKARNDVILATIKTTCDEVNRFIATQLTMLGKSVAEIEAEMKALQPKLEHLRSIRREIVGFLQTQSAILQDRLVISFQSQIKKLEAALPTEVGKFNLKPITGRSLVWAALTDWTRADENKFAKQAENCLKPQVQRLLEREFAKWQEAVIKNEMQAVKIDVEKHLLAEAEEYLRVMREIEEMIGIKASPPQVQELVERWLGAGGGNFAVQLFDLPAMGTMGEFFSWLIAGIIAEVIAHVVLHVATGGISLIVTGVLAIFRLGVREFSLQSKIQEQIISGIKTALNDMTLTQAAEIRAGVRTGFDGLERKIAGNIDEEIAIIDASLKSIIDRKKEKEFSAQREQNRLESARTSIAATVDRIHAALLTS